MAGLRKSKVMPERLEGLERARLAAGFTPGNPPRSLADVHKVFAALKTLQEARR